jgi:hypothetical protein
MYTYTSLDRYKTESQLYHNFLLVIAQQACNRF